MAQNPDDASDRLHIKVEWVWAVAVGEGKSQVEDFKVRQKKERKELVSNQKPEQMGQEKQMC